MTLWTDCIISASKRHLRVVLERSSIRNRLQSKSFSTVSKGYQSIGSFHNDNLADMLAQDEATYQPPPLPFDVEAEKAYRNLRKNKIELTSVNHRVEATTEQKTKEGHKETDRQDHILRRDEERDEK